MRIRRVFVDAELEPGREIDLPAETVNYLRNVLRLKDGQPLELFNGRGRRARAQLVLARREARVQVESSEPSPTESVVPITLMAALAKGEKMELVIQKAVELGVTTIAPVETERSVLELKGARAEKRIVRWRQIMINACEQCGRDILPTIEPIRSLDEAIVATEAPVRLVLDPRAERLLTELREQPRPDEVALLVGPEGGLTDDEVKTAIEHDFRALTLGPRILRAETAAITGVAVLQYQWGDLG
ncbi:16S rRNA (uracil(1498)-N(3))-methyltransferase [Guyparkeria hydrothermalis]|uniref:16S rRNA (uracil(1498)-N(3))-methyltransferase n=1 Tax=Guyparkeria hydrothermalis TaxID=923 RepID=UPI002021E344|nr:16S rRNA (uracil(1498)-N(3))-methyltransferase [Guyparkeria hydrothermalis]MCL7744803.1 16S rRNA (uracil(1498)-N(3))-methyltransferase [Guyparkeria hydrothermalis]